MPKELRKHLTVKGKKLVNVDITNSQPLFLALTIEKYIRENFTKVNNKYTNNQVEDINYNKLYKTLPKCTSIYLNMPSYDESSDLPRDFSYFRGLCESGKIYEYLQDRAGLITMTRGEIKEMFYTVVYGMAYESNIMATVIKNDFPTVWRCVYNMKVGCYQQLSRNMQRFESDFVIRTVVPRLFKEHPGVTVLTIHDSIMTRVGDEHIIYTVMMEEFAKLGIKPKLKIEG